MNPTLLFNRKTKSQIVIFFSFLSNIYTAPMKYTAELYISQKYNNVSRKIIFTQSVIYRNFGELAVFCKRKLTKITDCVTDCVNRTFLLM